MDARWKRLLQHAPGALRMPAAWMGALALAFTVAGCGGDSEAEHRPAEKHQHAEEVGSPQLGRAPSDRAPSDRAPSEPVLPPSPRWVPPVDEVLGAAKRVAADIAADLTTDPLGSPASSGRVIYPQLVGFADGAVAITVLVEQTILDPNRGSEVFRRVLDLRLRDSSEGWLLDGSGAGSKLSGERPPPLGAGPPGPSMAGSRVLAHPGIHLPHSAQADILEGIVSEELLELLGRIGDRHEIHVMTLVSQRPTRVFGTARPSHHAVGRAVDLYAVDGTPVVSQRSEGSPAHRLVLWLFEQEGVQIGSPWALDGFGGRSFTDLVHQDHLHIALPR